MGLISRLRGLFRASAGGNAGFPQAGVNGQPWGVEVNSPIKSAAGPVRGQPPTVYKTSGVNVRLLGWQAHPVVQACIRIIVDTAATVPLEVYTKRGKQDSLLPLHALQTVLDAPAQGFSARQLRSGYLMDQLVYGNAFWRLIRSGPGGPIVNIRRINPEGIQVVYVDSEMNVISYMWVDHFGRVHTTAAEDVVHFRDLQVNPPFIPDIFGYPRAAAALNSIVGDSEATRYVRQVVTNDGTTTLAIIMNDGVSQKDAETAQVRWNELMVNRGKRGSTSFLGGVKDIKPLGFNLSDLEFPDLRRVNREDICASFGVDPRMIGIASATKDAGLSGTQYVEARSRLVQHTIEPLLSVEEDTLNTWVTPEYGDVWVRYDRSVLQDMVEDDVATSTRIQGEFKAGLRTWEESREALHLPPDAKPTDAVFISGGQLVPVAIAVIDPTVVPDPALPATPDPKNLPPGSAGSGTPPSPEEVKKALVLSRYIARGMMLTPLQRQLLWLAQDERAKKEEADYKRTAKRLFSEEAASVAKIFHVQKKQADAHPRSAKADRAGHEDPYIASALRRARQGYKPNGEYHIRWADSYQSLIGKTYRAGAHELVSHLGIDFNLENTNIAAAIQARAERLASFVTQTTADQVSAAVAAGKKAGMGIGEIANLIEQSVFGGITESRSTTIARTETIGALNQGEFDTAVETGVMQSKEWLTQQDDRVRESHAAIDTERVDLDGPFSNGCMHPGDQDADPEETVNCRCTLLFYDEKA